MPTLTAAQIRALRNPPLQNFTVLGGPKSDAKHGTSGPTYSIIPPDSGTPSDGSTPTYTVRQPGTSPGPGTTSPGPQDPGTSSTDSTGGPTGGPTGGNGSTGNPAVGVPTDTASKSGTESVPLSPQHVPDGTGMIIPPLVQPQPASSAGMPAWLVALIVTGVTVAAVGGVVLLSRKSARRHSSKRSSRRRTSRS